MKLFLSTFVNKVDKKGRVSVPASYRAVLQEQSFAGAILYRSFSASCIEGCGMQALERLSASMSTLPTFSAEQDELASLIFADARQLAWDPEGRIVLPDDVMDHAKITSEVAFVGKGTSFQLWNPDLYREADAAIRARALANRPTLPPLSSKLGESQ